VSAEDEKDEKDVTGGTPEDEATAAPEKQTEATAKKPAARKKAAKPTKAKEAATTAKAGAGEGEKTPAQRPATKKAAAAREPAAGKSKKGTGEAKDAPAGEPIAATEAKEPETADPEKKKPVPSTAQKKKAASKPPRRRVVRAHARYVRTSARKARLVCPHIRGKTVVQARAILAFTPREVARDWSKLLDSAVANAENNHELLEDDLVVREAYADEGPTIKRFRPRAMGRATPIHKRTSHLTITLTPGS
jgi:ribosomal protein L22